MSIENSSDDFPAPLAVPAQIQARNAEYNLDLTGRVTHLDEKGLVTSFPVEIPEGTVLFSIIDLKASNATVRGLIRVRSQEEASELGGYRTLADFVDLNDDERRKISRLLGGAAESMASLTRGGIDESGALSQGVPMPASTRPSRPARIWLFPKIEITIGSFIWGVLGLIFYTIVGLGVVAIFPQGRAWELTVYHKLMHDLHHQWPGLGHLFGLL